MAGGGRPQAGRVTGLGPSVQTGCLPVVLSSRSSETLTPCRTRARAPLANPPRPQAAQQERRTAARLRLMKRGGWSPAIRGRNITCSSRCQQIASDLCILAAEGLLSHESCCMFSLLCFMQSHVSAHNTCRFRLLVSVTPVLVAL